MGIQLPDHYPSFAKDSGAKKWVRSHADLDKWFQFIDHIASGLALFPEDHEPPDKFLAAAIGGKIYKLQLFIPWAASKRIRFDTPERAMDACVAAGWCILQRYYDAVDKGKWVKPW